jgi:hypothetical protein
MSYNNHYQEKCKNSILKKGLIPPKIVERMTFNEMIEHLLRYQVQGEIWIPKRFEGYHEDEI